MMVMTLSLLSPITILLGEIGSCRVLMLCSSGIKMVSRLSGQGAPGLQISGGGGGGGGGGGVIE
jgi:hypothetical protein